MSIIDKKTEFRNKRLAAIDYGRKRVGFAVCDPMHITVSPRRFFQTDSDSFWDELVASISSEKPAALIVGVPYRLDGQRSDVIREIEDFMIALERKCSLPVIPYDESYSSVRALDTMLEIGTKKKKRRKKGNADMMAAAIILRDFLQELEG